MKIIRNIICSLSVLLAIGCSKDNKGDLMVDKSATITSLQVNGIAGEIDEVKQTISVVVPWSQSLSSMNVTATLPEGASISPALSATTDLSKGMTYRVTNGNLYWDYTLTASYPVVTEFAIGKYKGTIDNDQKTISVKYPKDEAVTALTPVASVTTGASLSPSGNTAIDFTNSITYTLSYRGESVAYTVMVIPTEFAAIGFLSTATKPAEITDADEKAAYEWFSTNVSNFKFISFADIKDGNVNLSDVKAIWWHLDSNANLPSEATNATVTDKLKAFYNNGGSFLFTTWAVQYVANLGIAKDGKFVNNMWNQTNSPNAIGDDWGISFKGNENHAIFKGLSLIAGRNNGAYLLSQGSKAKDHSAIWNFEWGDYANDIPRWTTENGAIQLASFHWDDAMSRAVIFEYPKSGNSGKVICIGIGSYDWYNEDGSPENTYFNNIKTLTSNCLDYLIN
ncbi:MAG: DUF4960 domain-containing protein [Capnocytophaga sp.]|nr:DUF4960 domain-containing protein [Capnocytophaga sp.]